MNERPKEKQLSRSKNNVTIIFLQLTVRTPNGSAGYHHSGSSAVIAYWKMQPVGLQGVVFAAKHGLSTEKGCMRHCEPGKEITDYCIVELTPTLVACSREE